jgi:hypothetical protein
MLLPLAHQLRAALCGGAAGVCGALPLDPDCCAFPADAALAWFACVWLVGCERSVRGVRLHIVDCLFCIATQQQLPASGAVCCHKGLLGLCHRPSVCWWQSVCVCVGRRAARGSSAVCRGCSGSRVAHAVCVRMRTTLVCHTCGLLWTRAACVLAARCAGSPCYCWSLPLVVLHAALGVSWALTADDRSTGAPDDRSTGGAQRQSPEVSLCVCFFVGWVGCLGGAPGGGGGGGGGGGVRCRVLAASGHACGRWLVLPGRRGLVANVLDGSCRW